LVVGPVQVLDAQARVAVPPQEATGIGPNSAPRTDVVGKPFSYLELRARVRALLRRCHGRQRRQVIQVGALRIDTVAREVRLGETTIDVSATEYALLTHLAREPTRVFTKHELLRDVWGFRAQGRTRTVV
jgi:DNA-binding response OmpR family regulator